MSVSSRPTRHMLRICLKKRKKMVRLALTVHACLDSTREAEARGIMSWRLACAI